METAQKSEPDEHARRAAMPVAFPPRLRRKVDAEAVKRKCSRASIVVAAVEQRYGGDADLRPTGEAHCAAILRFGAGRPSFTFADAGEATGLSYSIARRRIKQLVGAGAVVEVTPSSPPGNGTQKRFRVAEPILK